MKEDRLIKLEKLTEYIKRVGFYPEGHVLRKSNLLAAVALAKDL